MFTDLFVHQTTHLIAAMGVRYPGRVVGGGGIYLEYDGRDVPDVATVVADYDEGCQLIITATMCNDHAASSEVIRGHARRRSSSTGRRRLHEAAFEVHRRRTSPAGPAKPSERAAERAESISAESGRRATRPTPLWENFLECVPATASARRSSTPELGAAAFTTVNMGVQSYRHGKVLFWDKEAAKAGPRRRELGGASGRSDEGARQAEPDHRLGGRRQGRQHAGAAGLTEARRPVGRRQGPGGGVIDFVSANRGARSRSEANASLRLRAPPFRRNGVTAANAASSSAARVRLAGRRRSAYRPSPCRSWRRCACVLRSACRSRSGCSSPACRSGPCRCPCRPCTCSTCSPGTTRPAPPSSAVGRCPAGSRSPDVLRLGRRVIFSAASRWPIFRSADSKLADDQPHLRPLPPRAHAPSPRP